MVVIPVQVGRNTIEDVLLDGGSSVNIITEDLWKCLGLQAPKPTPYNLCMAYQTTTKPVRLIKDVCISIHDILYTVTFTVMNNCVVDDLYSMLQSRLWSRNAKVFYDLGTNMVTIEGNGTTRVIPDTKRLGHNTCRPQMLLSYNFQAWVTDEEENTLFGTEPHLFSIETITFPPLEFPEEPKTTLLISCNRLWGEYM